MLEMASLDDLKQDLAELEKFAQEAARQRVKGILTVESHKLKTQISEMLEAQKSAQASNEQVAKNSTTVHRGPKPWDQSDKFMKIYVSLDGVQNIAKDNITVEFTESSFRLHVCDLNGVDYVCGVVNLFEDIVPEKSYHKPGIVWYLKLARPPPVDKEGDPQENMMKLMQQMYEDGDDEMKRTIAKSMYESRMKSTVDL
ncbi:hypothetical protein LSH36_704g00013 [Paralvinella palmiformis]|uniref:Calcyclin-binding protein n=1 Tax=Paralvinella palmiformis TaxID=53620 RepID=A0AAD9MTP8_9ANNE|nr:hypothetical protein LSH36_704g00013 [Paralvinella palmiformis]